MVMIMEQLKGNLYLCLGFMLAGSSVIAAYVLANKLGVFTITFISLLITSIALLPFCCNSLFNTLQQLNLFQIKMIFLQALFGIFLFRLFLMLGIKHTSAGEAGIILGITPAITALLSWLVIKETLCKNSLLGIITTVLGILLLKGLFNQNNLSILHLLGNFLVMIAATSESIFNILSKKMLIKNNSHSLHPLMQTFLVTVIAMALCFIPSLFETPIILLKQLNYQDYLALLWYGFFVTVVAFIFWYAGIKRSTAFNAAILSGVMPLTSMVLSVLLLNEVFTYYQIIGGSLIIIGIVLIGLDKK